MCHNLSDNLGFFLLMKGQESVDANGQETVGVHAQVIQFMPPDHVADLVKSAVEGFQLREFGRSLILLVFLASMKVIKQ